MKATVDAVGRIVLPKPLRDLLGLVPGTTVDVSQYGAGLAVIPHGRAARLIDEDGYLVVAGDAEFNDDILFSLIDAGRR